MVLLDSFKNEFKKFLSISTDNIFLFWKGRVALYTILKSLRIREGDEIILPAYTCVVVPNVIIYLKAKPVYVDIDARTYNIDISKIEEKITDKTKVILAQNTYGLSPDLDQILTIADKYKLFVIEDCAQGFGGTYKGKPNGTLAHASFFSTQWNKPFSTGIGGIAVTKDEGIAERIRIQERMALKPSFKESVSLKGLLLVRDMFLNSSTYWNALKIYRFASKHNFILGSSQGKELDKPEIPQGFLKGFSNTQAKRGIQELMILDENLSHRLKIAEYYKNVLSEIDIQPPYEPDYASHSYLRFPLLVKEREKFFKMAEKNNIELGDWFISPLHPINDNIKLWKYNWGENPIAEKISRHIVNLPTHLNIKMNYAERISDFLLKNRDNIIPESNLFIS